MIIAGIGHRPETIEDRSITVLLRRKRADETVENFRPDRAPDLATLARKAARFAEDHRGVFEAADPEIPAGVFNRLADNWRPLFAVADVVGGEWPDRLRKVALGMADAALGNNTSTKVALLSDIRDIFTERAVDNIFSEVLVKALVEIEGSRWSEYRKNGKPITQNGVAKLLDGFQINPGTVRQGSKTLKGYRLDQFSDAFTRYLADSGDAAVTPSHPAENCGDSGESQPSQDLGCDGSTPPENPKETAGCDGVTVEKPLFSEKDGEWTA